MVREAIHRHVPGGVVGVGAWGVGRGTGRGGGIGVRGVVCMWSQPVHRLPTCGRVAVSVCCRTRRMAPPPAEGGTLCEARALITTTWCGRRPG